MATSPTTTIDREHVRARIEELQAELAQEELRLAEAKPEEPTGDEAMIRFKKFGYSWGAIRVFTPGVIDGQWGARVHWFVTQNGTRSARQGIPAMSWGDLLVWIGERNWDTIKEVS